MSLDAVCYHITVNGRVRASPRGIGRADLEPLLLTAAEVGHILGIGRTTVYALMRTGRLRGVTIGTSRRFSRDEVQRFIERLGADAAHGA